jgi:hypothetical protein
MLRIESAVLESAAVQFTVDEMLSRYCAALAFSLPT